MGNWRLLVGVSLLTVLFLWSVPTVESCNKYLCASQVSKCILLQSCECDMSDLNNCTCCTDCNRCLAKLYSECCSCVGMCPSETKRQKGIASSTVEEFSESSPDLFKALTSEPDPDMRWTTFTYSAHFDLLGFQPKDVELGIEINPDDGNRLRHSNGHRTVDIDMDSQAPNCTVAFVSDCMAVHKCERQCFSMGASSYRWFHANGCCECIGSTCLTFGKSHPHCINCPNEQEREEL